MSNRDSAIPGTKRNNTPALIFAILSAAVLWLSVTLTDKYFYIFSIPLKVTNIPAGLSPSMQLPETVHIKVKTTGWRLLSLFAKDLHYFVAYPADILDVTSIDLRTALSDNGWSTNDVEVIDLSPSRVSTGLEKTISVYRHVKSNIQLDFKPGYGLASDAAFTPDSILVSGSRKFVSNLAFVETESAQYKDVDQKFSEQFQLKTVNGVEFDFKSVNGFFNVQKIVETVVPNVQVFVRNTIPGREIVLMPAFIAVGIKGGIEYAGRVTPEDIQLFVNYEDVVADSTTMVTPEIILPKYIEKVYLEPEKLKFIIKKF